MVDGTDKRIEVPRNIGRFKVLCGFLVFGALCGFTSVAMGVVIGDAYLIVSGLATMAVFGVPAWLMARPLLHPTPAIVIDAEGFEDRTGALVEPLRVPWSQVVELAVRRPWSRYGRRQLVVVRLRDRDAVIPPGLKRTSSDLLQTELGFDHAVIATLTSLTPEQLLEVLERHRARTT